LGNRHDGQKTALLQTGGGYVDTTGLSCGSRVWTGLWQKLAVARFRAMELITISNRCHRFRGFVYQHPYFSADTKSGRAAAQGLATQQDCQPAVATAWGIGSLHEVWGDLGVRLRTRLFGKMLSVLSRPRAA
jgi:hypothetical protein